jgi:Protein of unknown function (DUF2393)
MSEPGQDKTHEQDSQLEQPQQSGAPLLFAAKPAEEPRRRWMLLAGLGLLVVLGVIAFAVRGHKGGTPEAVNQILPPDPYTPNLTFSQLAMSQSTSISGGTSTFIDGHVRNSGNRTLTGVTVQVLFGNDEGMAPQVETLPLSLIRAHEPYVDTEPLSGAPLKPGDEKEFRLIFESVPGNWNQMLPEIHVVKATSL